MFYDVLKDTVLRRMSRSKMSPGGWTSLNCPMCTSMGEPRPDTRKRGGFNFTADNSIVYNCFNCGYKTGFRPDGILGQKMLELLKALGVPEPEANRLKIESIRSRDANEHAEFKPYKPSFDWSEVLLPEESKPLDENTDPIILAYLQSRGSGIYENWNYYWSSSSYMHLNERVIIPCYHKNKIVGWIARHVKPNKTDKPKYYVSVQRNYLFNCDQLYTKDRQYAIIVEGPFDAIGIDGIAICGSQISAGQSEYLNSFKKDYILMPDRDRAGKKMIVQAIQNGWSVSFPNWGDNVKDVADAVKKYGRIFTLQSIINNAEKNPVKINIKKRMS